MGLAYPLIAAAGAALPSILLVAFFYRMDRKRPEPRGLIARSVLLGFLAVLPAIIIEAVLLRILPAAGRFAEAAIKGFVVAGLVEEGVKFAFVKAWLYARKEFDEAADGIVYTVCVSLGFALVENVMFALVAPGSVLIRAFTAVPMHAAASGLMGYYIGVSKTGTRDTRNTRDARDARNRLALGLALAVGVHGLYDFFAFSGGSLAYLVFPVTAVSFAAVIALFGRARAMDDAASGRGPGAAPGSAPAS